MRSNHSFRTAVALAAVTSLLGACSDDSADDDERADERPSSSSASPTEDGPTKESPTEESPTEDSPTEEASLPDGVLALPEADPGSDFASLAAGRYHVPLNDTLAFEVDVPDDTTAHDDGLFLATETFVLKTEVAGEEYGLPRDPCTDQDVEPVGPTVDDLVQAMGDLPIYEVSSPEPAELGGADGTYFEARIPADYDASQCEGQAVQLPGNPTTAVNGPPPYIGRWWVLDVDGQRVVVQQNCWGCSADQFADAPETPQTITFTSVP